MKLVILAGGLRSTIHDDFEGIPKPMVEIGGEPILWHIMKHYSSYGIKEFIVCGGYKINMIKDYFRDFYVYQSDITVDLAENTVIIHKKRTEDWQVTVVDTGTSNSPGGRIKRVREYLADEDFLVTYGDCLSDINVCEFIEKHKTESKLVTMMFAKPTGRNSLVESTGEAWTNGCTFIYSNRIWSEVDSYITAGGFYLPFGVNEQERATYRHSTFWTPVETMRDKMELEHLWEAGNAPWKVWD